MNTSEAASVIDLFYRHHFTATTPLPQELGAAGGYSGARFWKIDAGNDHWCLRRWPASALQDERRLHWIHRQLATAFSSGCEFIAVPALSSTQETLVEHHEHLWQLEPWMPGSASYRREPSSAKLTSAMQALAEFHKALRSDPCRRETSPGIRQRIQRLSQMFDGKDFTDLFRQIEIASRDFPADPGFLEAAARICMRFRSLTSHIHERLNLAARIPVENQTVIADIWHDHVLFTGNQVSGLVDFGAMRMDTPACDIARLLGSLVADDPSRRKLGLTAWLSVAKLPPSELELIALFDDSATLMSGLNWLQWICVEGRKFGDLRPISQRMQVIARRMDFLASSL